MGVVLFWFDLGEWILIGDEIGTPWKDDWSKKEVLVLLQRDEVKVVVMDAIDEELEGVWLCCGRYNKGCRCCSTFEEATAYKQTQN